MAVWGRGWLWVAVSGWVGSLGLVVWGRLSGWHWWGLVALGRGRSGGGLGLWSCCLGLVWVGTLGRVGRD